MLSRFYKYPDDYETVGRFLVRTYQMDSGHRNWLQPRWEYMHYHPCVDMSNLGRIGIWEEAGEVVGVAHHEHRIGEVYFQIHPQYARLKKEMLEYAASHLCRDGKEGKTLQVYINADDPEFESIARGLGFRKDEACSEPMSQLDIADPFPAIRVPKGFRLKSLQEENDLNKTNRVLHRGFNHQGEPPADGVEGRRMMQSAPNFRKDLTIVMEAPNGDFVSYCGMWHEPERGFAYVEPVATDPDYRRLGLGTAVVLEGIRRCGKLGAAAAFVGTAKPFYKAMGFYEIFNQYLWKKTL